LDVRLVLAGTESPEDVEEYARAKKLRFAVLHDPQGVNAKAWRLGGVAYGLVLDAEGRVLWQGRIGPQGDAQGCESAIRKELSARKRAGTLVSR